MVSAALVVGDLVQITYEPGIDADGSAGNEAYLRLGNITSIGSTDTFDLSGTFVEPNNPIRLSIEKTLLDPFSNRIGSTEF
jgi:hypothetical protein